jgi:putative SOS response-associated peptidase YedK
MCGRYTLTVSLDELITYYELGESTQVSYHKPRYNIAPTQQVLAVIHDGERNRLGELRWGLIPKWAKDPKIGVQMINARAETLSEKPAFQSAFERRRCLIPADSFYDWKQTTTGKQPFRIHLNDRALFSFAGLYDTWTSPDGQKISSCSIITTTPNDLMATIHHRMPVILQRHEEQDWLNRQQTNSKLLAPYLVPYPSEQMVAYPVSAKVGHIRNDDETCILPMAEEEE